MDLEQHLHGIGVRAQMPHVHRHADGTVQGTVPQQHHPGQRITHRARTVVKFHRAADVDAAGIDFSGHLGHPAIEQRAQARQAARLLDGGPGNDTLSADGANATLLGGDGNDSLRGGTGSDSLDGGAGDDEFFSRNDTGDGSDTIHAGSGTNYIEGGRGDDVIHGGGTFDILSAGGGDDVVNVGDGRTTEVRVPLDGRRLIVIHADGVESLVP